MNDFYGYPENDYRNYLMHYGKGERAKEHKYIDIINGRYIYPAVNAVKGAATTIGNKVSYAKSRVGAKANGTINKIKNYRKLRKARKDIQSQIQENKSRLREPVYRGTTADDYRSRGRATRQNKYLDPGTTKREGMNTRSWWHQNDIYNATLSAQREKKNKKKKVQDSWTNVMRSAKKLGKKKVSKEYTVESLYNSMKNRYPSDKESAYKDRKTSPSKTAKRRIKSVPTFYGWKK